MIRPLRAGVRRPSTSSAVCVLRRGEKFEQVPFLAYFERRTWFVHVIGRDGDARPDKPVEVRR